MSDSEDSPYMKKAKAVMAKKLRRQPPVFSKALDDAEEKVKELGAKQRAAQDLQTPEDAAEKLRKAKEMKVEMIDPALAITGAIAGGVVAGNLLDRLRLALKSPAEKDKMRRVEIERAQQAAKKPITSIKMPTVKFGPKKDLETEETKLDEIFGFGKNNKKKENKVNPNSIEGRELARNYYNLGKRHASIGLKPQTGIPGPFRDHYIRGHYMSRHEEIGTKNKNKKPTIDK